MDSSVIKIKNIAYVSPSHNLLYKFTHHTSLSLFLQSKIQRQDKTTSLFSLDNTDLINKHAEQQQKKIVT